jgi:hypothetical protein
MEAGGGDSGEWRLLFGLEGAGRRARYQVSGLFDSLAQPRDASATNQEELISCLAFSVHWHSRETRQPHRKRSLSVAGHFRFNGTAARRVSHIERGAYQLLGFFDSLAQPRDASATYQEELISCLAFSFHWHSRETRQLHIKKSFLVAWPFRFIGTAARRFSHMRRGAVSVAGLFRFIGTAARRVSYISRRAFQLLGLFGSLAQPRDASATYQEELFSCLAFSIHWHGRETRQPHGRQDFHRSPNDRGPDPNDRGTDKQ